MNLARVSSLFFGAVGVFLLAGCGAVFINQGSPNASFKDGLLNPNSDHPKKIHVSSEAKIISTFDDGSVLINPKLYGGANGSWSVFSSNGNLTNSGFIVAGGAEGTPACAHVFGILMDRADGKNPAFTLQGKFLNNGCYDASAFKGIKFFYKCPATDQALKRRFSIGIAPTVPVSEGGTCADATSNHFGGDLMSSTDWVSDSFDFADLKREPGLGKAVSPPDLTDHLKEFIYIRWDHSALNTAGNYNIDYWVDEVEFY